MTCQPPSNQWTDKGDGNTTPPAVNPVLSVFGRTGNVVADAADYAAFYAALNHNHDADYSAINHVHSVFSLNVNGFVKAPVTENGWFLRDDGEWINPAVIPGSVEEAPADGEPKVRLGNTPEWLSAGGLYAALVHNHDAAYSAIGHNHDADYAALVHTHSAFAGAGTVGFVPDPVTESGRVLQDDGTWAASGGAAPVDSVFTRTGAVVALTGDYAAFYAALVHTHPISDVTGLQTALDGKAATVHTHVIADVTGLQTALDGKAATVHTHVISDVTGLQTELDGKAAVVHTHLYADITDAPNVNWLGSEAAPSVNVVPGDSLGINSVLDASTRQPLVDDFLKATRGKQTIWVSGGGFLPLTTNGAEPVEADLNAGGIKMYALDFDAVTQEKAQFNFIMPASGDLSTLQFAAIWRDNDTPGTGDVHWSFRSVAFRDGDLMTTDPGNNITVVDTYQAANIYHKSALSAAQTPAGTQGAGNMYQVEVSRAAGADDYTQDARLLGVEVLYGINDYKDGEL